MRCLLLGIVRLWKSTAEQAPRNLACQALVDRAEQSATAVLRGAIGRATQFVELDCERLEDKARGTRSTETYKSAPPYSVRNDHAGGAVAAGIRRYTIAVRHDRTLDPLAIDKCPVGASTVDHVATAIGVMKEQSMSSARSGMQQLEVGCWRPANSEAGLGRKILGSLNPKRFAHRLRRRRGRNKNILLREWNSYKKGGIDKGNT